MNEPLTADRYPSVEWGEPVDVDPAFLENVELVPQKAAQALIDPIHIEKHIDKVVEMEKAHSWAAISSPPNFHFHLRNLFKRRILSSFVPQTIIDTIDEYIERHPDESSAQEAEFLYEMLFSLDFLNELLEKIRAEESAIQKG